jgi:Secretion system C-terminal sorting domain
LGQSAIVELANVAVSGKDVTFELRLTPSSGSTIYLGNFDVRIDLPAGNPVVSATRTIRASISSEGGTNISISTSISSDGKSINYQPAAPGSQEDFNDLIAKISGSVSLGTYKITFTNALSGVMQCGGTLVYTLAPSVAALPLDLLDFSASALSENAKPKTLLTWKTANEKDVDYYEVQRSLNGVDFTPLSKSNKIEARNSDLETYETTDETPTLGVNYYRLKMVDMDGSFKLSNIRSVDFGNPKKGSKIKIYPNPTDDNLQVLFDSNAAQESKNYTIFNLLGQVLMQGELTNNVNISSLPAGAYFIKVENDLAQFLKQ